MLDTEHKKMLNNRLRRIEGQLAGIRRMAEQDAYCVDMLTQIAAAQAALAQAGKLVLGQHMKTCVTDTFASGSQQERETRIAELLDVFVRYAGTGRR